MARCASCGRPLCLTCAVPVRGRVLGAECLTAALGPDAVPDDAIAAREPSSSSSALTGVAFALALVATFLPWSRFGIGSDAFGAWGKSIRWSLLTAVAAASGLALWIVLRAFRPRPRPWMGLALAILGALLVLGALLAILRPPPFTRTWVGPWVAMGAGVMPMASGVRSRWAGSLRPIPRS